MSDMNIVSQLMEITGLSKNAAENCLLINNYDLEQAINYHLENNYETDYPSSNTTVITNDICNSNNSVNNRSNQKRRENKDGSVYSSSSSTAATAGSASIAAAIGATASTTSISSSASSINNDYDNIRAPIPSRREQLLLPEEDNFRFRKRRAPAFSVCPLRNFAREAEIQEQQLAATGGFIHPLSGTSSATMTMSSSDPLMNDNNDYIATSSGFIPAAPLSSTNRFYDDYTRSITKRQRLEDLFRPPTDLLFWGTFQAARDYATSCNRWLIVNLQDNSEFKSQILNRDIWPDPDLKQLILKYFIFWQVSVDNPEGLRFKIFYHVETMPYVCVIDPRTGENKFSCDVVTPQTFCSDLHDFLNQNSYTLDASKGDQSTLNNSSLMRNNSTLLKSKLLKTSELSEEDQLELAIRNSLKETHSQIVTKATSSSSSIHNDESLDDGDVNVVGYDDSTTQSDDLINDTTTTNSDIVAGINSDDTDNQVINATATDTSSSSQNYNHNSNSNNYKQYLGDKNDSITKIQLRLPGGERDHLEWPSTSKLKAIKLYVQSKYPDIAKEPFKIILSFPRQNILELDDDISLKNANLHPSVILHLHPDD